MSNRVQFEILEESNEDSNKVLISVIERVVLKKLNLPLEIETKIVSKSVKVGE
ncbi:hypothetical protein [Alkalihalobacillus pseudalcaliphilus]|uniref:hypothetical protein n=1 Tax=Alkalihalobacillus pseudalcaliphilus TaxID=79884 RepID=UPI000AD8690F|nr:hypothetical protein [Alkalihalobacillus pseudalcaliphilus]